MGFIDRYVYAVTKGLPEKQRGDIDRELRSIIEDMMEQYGETESNDIKIQKVLVELGNPELLAKNYRGTKRYLIGPQYFDNYLMVLPIVIGAIFLGISIATIIANFTDTSIGDNIVNILVGYVGALVSGVFQGFAWVTVTFALVEYSGVKFRNQSGKKQSWSLSQLPQIPHKEALIPRIGTIVSIIFFIAFFIIIVFASQIIGAYNFSDKTNTVIIPIFNTKVFIGEYGFLLVLIFILGILKESIKLIWGRWTLRLSAAIVSMDLVTMILTLIIFSNPKVWYNNFPSELTKALNLNFNFSKAWDMITGEFVAAIIVVTILEIIITLYKGIKYNNLKQ